MREHFERICVGVLVVLFGCISGLVAIPLGLLYFVNFKADYDLVFFFVLLGVSVVSALVGFVVGASSMSGFYALLWWSVTRRSSVAATE